MKKRTILVVCVLLLCGGLSCLHLTGQNTSSSAVPTSLLDYKLDECSELELLELKIAACQTIVRHVTAAAEMGSPSGRFTRLETVRAGLAAAEIELYRHTGDQEKLLAAHKARVEALTHKLQAVTNSYEAAYVTAVEVSEAEIQLLDALREQKREQKHPQITASSRSKDMPQPCPQCKGTGNAPFQCFHCKGAGKQGSFQCSLCKGTGWQRCSTCGGTGFRH